MDIILPLNETRHRQQMFRLKFFIDEEEYFYLIYFYIVWCSFATVMIAVTIDSLYIQLRFGIVPIDPTNFSDYGHRSSIK